MDVPKHSPRVFNVALFFCLAVTGCGGAELDTMDRGQTGGTDSYRDAGASGSGGAGASGGQSSANGGAAGTASHAADAGLAHEAAHAVDSSDRADVHSDVLDSGMQHDVADASTTNVPVADAAAETSTLVPDASVVNDAGNGTDPAEASPFDASVAEDAADTSVVEDPADVSVAEDAADANAADDMTSAVDDATDTSAADDAATDTSIAEDATELDAPVSLDSGGDSMVPVAFTACMTRPGPGTTCDTYCASVGETCAAKQCNGHTTLLWRSSALCQQMYQPYWLDLGCDFEIPAVGTPTVIRCCCTKTH